MEHSGVVQPTQSATEPCPTETLLSQTTPQTLIVGGQMNILSPQMAQTNLEPCPTCGRVPPDPCAQGCFWL